jgi:predicted Fe-S protein YdhL (DUF1289 family)
MAEEIGKWTRVTGTDRTALMKRAAKLYGQGYSVRAVGEKLARSYGATHRLLSEAGVTFRPRGYRHGSKD